MYNYKNITISKWFIIMGFIPFSLFFSSCDEDSFSQIVKIDIPEHESKVALSALWLSQDTIPLAYINKSISALSLDQNSPPPTDATVKLFINGTLASQAEYGVSTTIFNQNYIFKEEKITATAGDEYRIEATFGDLPTASAVQIMPSIVPIESVEYIKNGGTSADGEQLDKLKLSFTDANDTEDYYLIRLFNVNKYPNGQDTIIDFQHLYLEANDPTIAVSEGNLLFSDRSFNGKAVTIQGLVYGWGIQSQSFEAHLIHITKDAYHYLNSVTNYRNADGNPFAQPVTVYNNITDGYGVFGLGNTDKKAF